ncbi:MAG: hypothetical protein R3B89_16510 [Polyangiaceae bacterium]
MSGNYRADVGYAPSRMGEACPGFTEDGCASGLFCSADTGGNGVVRGEAR